LLLDRQQQCQAFFVLLPCPLFESRIESASQAADVLLQHFPQGLERRVFLVLLVVAQIVLECCLSGQGFDTGIAILVRFDFEFLFQLAKKPLRLDLFLFVQLSHLLSQVGQQVVQDVGRNT
jgi:hypothetical protein